MSKNNKLYNRNLIIPGLIIFIAILIFPVWNYFLFSNETSTAPEPVLSKKALAAKECVEPKEFMKTEHMQLLDQWRDGVVRLGDRTYKSTTGKLYNASLSSGEKSCLGCHVDKAQFCDKCHTYASVQPYCWDCHIDPKEKK